MAEWLGRALQKLPQRFESARDLPTDLEVYLQGLLNCSNEVLSVDRHLLLPVHVCIVIFSLGTYSIDRSHPGWISWRYQPEAELWKTGYGAWILSARYDHPVCVEPHLGKALKHLRCHNKPRMGHQELPVVCHLPARMPRETACSLFTDPLCDAHIDYDLAAKATGEAG